MPQRNWENVISLTGSSTLMLSWYSSGSYPVVPTSPRRPKYTYLHFADRYTSNHDPAEGCTDISQVKEKTFLTSIIQIFPLKLFGFCFVLIE